MANPPANVLSGQIRSAVSSLFLSHTVVCALPSPEERHTDVRERKVRLVRKPAMQEVAGSNPVAPATIPLNPKD
jgi:hypothetical protein